MLRRLRISHLLVALLIDFLSSYSVAYGVTMLDMSGTWIIASEPYDSLIDGGIIAAEYPVLVITDQGDFRAYRFGVDCRSDVTMNQLTPEVEQLAPCVLQLSESDADHLTGLAFPIAQGNVVVDDSGLRFWPKDRQPLLDAIKNSRKTNPLVDGVPYQYMIFTKLFDGILHASVREEQLKIAEPNGRFGYRFVRVNSESIAGVGSLLNVLGLSYGQYFRCALDHIKDVNLLKNAKRIQELSNRKSTLYFHHLHERSKLYLTDLQRLSEQQSVLHADLIKMPAAQASTQGKLGMYLGCPDRDR